LTEAEAGVVAPVLAVREAGRRDHVAGRFFVTEDGPEDGLRPDLGGEKRPEIERSIRNVRDMNGLIGSLASVACVFDEEHPEGDEDGPNP
jgi:hypothetical protein